MTSADPLQGDDVNLRKEAGLWLKKLREEVGLSQRELSKKVGFEYYTFISQIESGRGKVPPDKYNIYAEALNVTPYELVKTLLKYYHPIIDEILFGKNVDNDVTVMQSRAETNMSARLEAIEQFINKLKE